MQLESSDMDLRLEVATEQHRKFFWEQYADSMRVHIDKIWGWDSEWQKNDFQIRWLSCENQLIVQGETPIGYFQTHIQPDSLYLIMFIVLPKQRNKGVGKEALRILRANCDKPLIRMRVFESNQKALNFYIRLGFELIEKEGGFYVLQQAVA
ncbi:MAG: GNAT family N-acetyltransferase [Methyloprofundus sp.]|nr:GNAT family N-acetyltransferase [Methyloprofundus sp.]